MDSGLDDVKDQYDGLVNDSALALWQAVTSWIPTEFWVIVGLSIGSLVVLGIVSWVKGVSVWNSFAAVCTAVLDLFRHKFTLYGFTISYWDVLIWSLVAGIVISFIKGLLTGDE